MTAMIRIDARFNGPSDSANGGYAAGLIAGAIGESVNIRLVRPVPIDCELTIVAAGTDRWEARRDYDVIALATLTEIAVEVPQPVPYIEALGVSKHYAGFGQHNYPQCFVCGPARPHNDGLRIFPGSVPGTNIVAAPWLLDDSLDDGAGKVRPEFVWAALDCPGYFASASPKPALLGELAVHIDRPVHIDEACVVIGWPISAEGRKHRVGTALFDEDGERCAVGVATWITLQNS